MPKASREQIADDEKKIIRELQKNSKESIDKIAKKCGFSRQKVWRIIKRLEKNKTIWGYSVVADGPKLDMKQFFILMKRRNIAISKEDLNLIVSRGLKNKLANMGVDAIGSYFVHGSFEWVVLIDAPNVIYAKKFVEMFMSRFKDYISDIQILEVIFPVQINGIDNPNMEEFLNFF